MYGSEIESRVDKLLEWCAGKPGRWAGLCRRYPESSDSDLGSEPTAATMQRCVYLAERRRGVEHVWAAMTATRKGPALNTDVSFFEGKRFLGDGLNDQQLACVIRAAKASGYNPSQADIYVPALASFVGDPKAFVPAAGGRSHIKAVVEERNWDCEGVVRRKRDDRRESPVFGEGPQLADDLAMEAAQRHGILQGGSHKELPDVLQEMRQKHGLSDKAPVRELSTEAATVIPAVAPKKPRKKP
jgi:hypothetical protein